MSTMNQKILRAWAGMSTRYLPFAEAASADLPLSRLLRLSLFQVSVGMALVLLIGTLNRVMIVELDVPASLVAVMVSLPDSAMYIVPRSSPPVLTARFVGAARSATILVTERVAGSIR